MDSTFFCSLNISVNFDFQRYYSPLTFFVVFFTILKVPHPIGTMMSIPNQDVTMSMAAIYISMIHIHKLQNDIWNQSSDLETHTVETHIYRLRKKIGNKFNDKNFIISHDNGYLI